MKKSLIVVSGLALIASLGACAKEAEAPKPTETVATSASNMSNMPMASEMKQGKSTGTVTAIDAAKGTITLDHGEMTGLQWPDMKMSFAIKPELVAGIKVGDKVNFEIHWDGKAGTVTSIRKSD